jgi:hypothetical protein
MEQPVQNQFYYRLCEVESASKSAGVFGFGQFVVLTSSARYWGNVIDSSVTVVPSDVQNLWTLAERDLLSHQSWTTNVLRSYVMGSLH